MMKRKTLLSMALSFLCCMSFACAFVGLRTTKATAEQTQESMYSVVQKYYTTRTLQKAGTTDEANRVTYSGLVPYGTGTISLGTYDMSANVGLDNSLFEILPQNAWNDTADTTTYQDKFFKVYLTSGEKQVIYHFRQRADGEHQAMVLVGDNDSDGGYNLGGRYMTNGNQIHKCANVGAILPYLYNGTGLESGAKNEKQESFTKPTPLGFYYDNGNYYNDFIYGYTLNQASYLAEETSTSGTYRYIMNDYTTKFTAEELKNITVSVSFEKGTVAQDEAWVMFTSIAGKKLSTDFYSVDINYETFGGSIQDAAYTQKVSANDDQISVLPVNVTKEYYTFSHWYYGTNPENKVNEEGFTEWLHEQNESITLSAYYVPVEYDVTYDLNYSGAPTYDKDTVTVSNYQGYEFKQIPFENYPEGKIFDGWYTEATGGEKVTQISKLDDVIVYAHWSDGYIVTFINDGVEEKIPYAAGTVVTEPQVANKTGYTFDGWFNGNELYDFANVLTSNLTLTAKYTEKTFTVTFYAGGVVVDEKTVTYGQTISELPNVPEAAAGYEAGAWQYDGKPFTSEIVVDKNIIVVAVYPKITVEITFNVDGGSEIASITLAYGETLDGKGVSTSKEGYDFVGWQNNGQVFDLSTEITENIQLTAVWKLKEYTVNIIQNGESVGTINKKHGEKITLQEVSDVTNVNVSQLYTDASLLNPYDLDGMVLEDMNLYIETEVSQGDVGFIDMLLSELARILSLIWEFLCSIFKF